MLFHLFSKHKHVAVDSAIIITIYLNSMEHSQTWEATQEIPNILLNLNVHCYVLHSRPLASTQNRMSPVHNLPF